MALLKIMVFWKWDIRDYGRYLMVRAANMKLTVDDESAILIADAGFMYAAKMSGQAMEAIGGTGDTLTGIVAALIGAGIEINEAAGMAARVNRLAGHSAEPTPATQIMDIIERIPAALVQVLDQKANISENRHV